MVEGHWPSSKREKTRISLNKKKEESFSLSKKETELRPAYSSLFQGSGNFKEKREKGGEKKDVK